MGPLFPLSLGWCAAFAVVGLDCTASDSEQTLGSWILWPNPWALTHCRWLVALEWVVAAQNGDQLSIVAVGTCSSGNVASEHLGAAIAAQIVETWDAVLVLWVQRSVAYYCGLTH